jgi:hypothetical protein
VEQITLRECAQCKTYIKPGEPSREVLKGIEGRCPNTGYMATLDPPGRRETIEAVHEQCFLEWAAVEKEDEWNDYIWEMANELAVEMINEERQNPDSDLNRRLEDDES